MNMNDAYSGAIDAYDDAEFYYPADPFVYALDALAEEEDRFEERHTGGWRGNPDDFRRTWVLYKRR